MQEGKFSEKVRLLKKLNDDKLTLWLLMSMEERADLIFMQRDEEMAQIMVRTFFSKE